MTGGGLDRWPAERSGITIYPDSWKRSLWNDARTSTPSKARAAGVDDVAFLRALIAPYRGGDTRVYGVGYSNGGQLVIRAVLEAPPLFDAAALLSATVPAPENLVVDTSTTPVPVLMSHGTKDPLVPHGGGMASLFGFRPRGMMRSAEDSARFWAARNDIRTAALVSTLPASRDERTRTTVHSFEEPGRPPVQFYSTAGGGHVVPAPGGRNPRIMGRASHDVDLPRIVLDFFESQEVDPGSVTA